MNRTSAKRSLFVGATLALVLLAGGSAFDVATSYGTAEAVQPVAHASLTPPSDGTAPDFALPMLSGETFRLSEQRGRVVVLNFWATWCPPCRHEIPDFIAMQSHFGAEDVTFVGVSLDHVGPEDVAAFADEMGVNYPIVIDDGTADAAYGPLATLPTTFLIDRDGVVRGYAPGMVTREMLEPAIAQLVEKPVSSDR